MNAKQFVKGLNFKSLAMTVVVLFLLLTPELVFAHHSFAAEFDFDKPLTVRGTVTKWEMINPHAYISIDVKNDDGTMSHWSVQIGAPSFLYRNGWRKDSVKPGDELTISGFRAKDGSDTMYGQQALLADGRRVLGGAPVSAAAAQNPAPSAKPANQ
jgi:hypothetical protein